MSAAPDAQPVPGYRLAEVLGRGGAGTVYRALREDDALARAFAVKVFPPAGRGAYDRELAALKEIEAARAARGSRDLIETIGAGETRDGGAYVVMELLEGGTLERRVQLRGPLPAEEAVALLLPALRGLALLHDQSWVHKDVKPANVLLGGDGAPRLADFGLSRSAVGPLSAAGTPGYCAPELVRGRAEAIVASGLRLDVYAAGATLYYLLTGEAPLPGRPDLLVLERRRVPRSLQEVLFACLADEPRDRPGSALGVVERLEAWQRGDSPAAAGTGARLTAAAGWLLVALLLAGLGSTPLALAAAGVLELDPHVTPAAPQRPAPSRSPRASAGAIAAATSESEAATVAPLTSVGPAATELVWSPLGALLGAPAHPVAPALRRLDPQPVSASLDPSGTLLAVAGPAGEARLLDLTRPADPTLSLPAPAAAPQLVCVAARGDGALTRLLVAADGETATLEIARAGAAPLAFPDLPPATAAAWLPELGGGWQLVLAHPDGRLVLYSLTQGPVPLAVWRSHRFAVWALWSAPDGARLWVLGDDRWSGRAEVYEQDPAGLWSDGESELAVERQARPRLLEYTGEDLGAPLPWLAPPAWIERPLPRVLPE